MLKKEKINPFLYILIVSLVFVLPSALQTAFANSFGILFGYLSVLYMFYRRVVTGDFMVSRAVLVLLGILAVWCILSVINSVRYYDVFGELGGIDTFTAPLGSLYYHIVYVFIFISYIDLINFQDGYDKTVKKAFHTIVDLEMIIGFIQLMLIQGSTLWRSVYDFINIFNLLPKSAFLLSMSRITMTGSEPASMGALLGVLALPFLLSFLMEAKDRKERIITFIKIILLIVLGYFSKSTTVYIEMIAIIYTFLFWLVKNKYRQLTLTFSVLSLVGLFAVGNAIISRQIVDFNSDVSEQIYYYAVLKPTDTSNMSTMHRFSTTVNDIEIIKDYPLFGVGDGNQGLLYGKNLPSYMLINPKTQELAQGKNGIVNGGAWFWAVASGYGLFGLSLLIYWFSRYYMPLTGQTRKDNYFYYKLLVFALPTIIITLLTGAMNPRLLFVLSIPFWKPSQEKEAV